MRVAKSNPPPLATDYYLQNFTTLLDFVFEHYPHLLNVEEQHFYEVFNTLDTDSQRLYVRLTSRSGNYIRCRTLDYSEIRHCDTCIETLIKQGFLLNACAATADQWLGIFARSDLACYLPAAANTKLIDPDLMTEQDMFGQSPLTLLMAHEPVVEVQHKLLLQTYRLLFFGNLHQDFSAFVLRDLGMRTFESYLIDHGNLPFTSRAQIDAYLQYYGCAEACEAAMTDGPEVLLELHQQLPGIQPGDRALTRRIEKMANRIARQLERFDALEAAAAIYRTNNRPPARERLTRLECKLGNDAAAFCLCQEIESNPADAEELAFARQFGSRLAKKISVDYAPVTTSPPPTLTVTLEKSALPVELACALHFAREGKCYYVENALIGGVFGLAMWDIIFAPIAGAFYHPFQSAPADFQEADFYQQRKTLFENRFRQINNGLLSAVVLDHFHQKNGIANPLVSWQRLNRLLLVQALKRIPVSHWLHLFEFLCKDIRNHRSGLPDLVFFPDTGGYQLIEVKGPGDRLQKNQLRWMHHFALGNIDHTVVHVNYPTDSGDCD